MQKVFIITKILEKIIVLKLRTTVKRFFSN